LTRRARARATASAAGRIRRIAERLLCPVLVGALLVVRWQAAAAEAPPSFEHVIPAGQDEVLGKILGLGVALPGGCSLARGNAAGAVVTVEYACSAGKVVFELRHPDDAPADALRTERFAVVLRSGSVPPGLLDALASLIRANEGGFHWKETEQGQSTLAGMIRVFGVAAALSGIVAVGLAVQFLLRRRLPASGPWPWPVGALFALASSAALCAFVHAALRALGSLAIALLWQRSGAEIVASLARLAALVPAALAVGTLVARFASRRPLRAWVAVAVIAYVAVGYRMSLLPDDLNYFGTLSTSPPNTSAASEAAGGRPAVVYRTNAFGFRQPAFVETKAAGVIRVALIGDSYVYGTGIDENDTLRARLVEALAGRWPGRRFEVLNLGIPGDNLASHVALFDVATARLHPDAVVLCLTLANDLSRWDGQVERRDARRLGLFSFARFLFGDAAPWLWAATRLEVTITPAGLRHLDEQIDRLERLRSRAAGPRVFAFFAFHEWDPAVRSRLSRAAASVVVPDGRLGPEDFIPGDGHPTGIGNTGSARRIVDTLAVDPRWLELVGAAPPG
jgi:GDSL-like Lipase/Acylhydrolase family